MGVILFGLMQQDLLDLNQIITEINDSKAKGETKLNISYVTTLIQADSLDPAQFTDANLKILIEIFYKWMEPKEKFS